MRAGGRVLIANQDLPVLIAGPHPNLTMDIQMMTLLTGRERVGAEWAEIFRQAGLRILAKQSDQALVLRSSRALPLSTSTDHDLHVRCSDEPTPASPPEVALNGNTCVGNWPGASPRAMQRNVRFRGRSGLDMEAAFGRW